MVEIIQKQNVEKKTYGQIINFLIDFLKLMLVIYFCYKYI